MDVDEATDNDEDDVAPAGVTKGKKRQVVSSSEGEEAPAKPAAKPAQAVIKKAAAAKKSQTPKSTEADVLAVAQPVLSPAAKGQLLQLAAQTDIARESFHLQKALGLASLRMLGNVKSSQSEFEAMVADIEQIKLESLPSVQALDNARQI